MVRRQPYVSKDLDPCMDEITLGIAIIGAVLGSYSLWHQIRQSRVKLRVTPEMAYPFNMGDDRPRIGVEVVNDSAFPVTISDVGFTIEGTTGARMLIVNPIMFDGGRFPRRLDARESFTVYFAPGTEDTANFQRALRAYATTTTGVIKHSSAKSVRGLKRR